MKFENGYEWVNSNSAGGWCVPGHLAGSGSGRDATGERDSSAELDWSLNRRTQ